MGFIYSVSVSTSICIWNKFCIIFMFSLLISCTVTSCHWAQHYQHLRFILVSLVRAPLSMPFSLTVELLCILFSLQGWLFLCSFVQCFCTWTTKDQTEHVSRLDWWEFLLLAHGAVRSLRSLAQSCSRLLRLIPLHAQLRFHPTEIAHRLLQKRKSCVVL